MSGTRDDKEASKRLDRIAAAMTDPRLARRLRAHLSKESDMEKSHDFTHVRIPNTMIAEAEALAEQMADRPEFAELRLRSLAGKVTPVLRLAIERGFAALRAEIAKPARKAKK